jgi:hypothetical protein
MSEQKHQGIYLIVDFDWPSPFDAEDGKKARHLHDVLQNQTWIRENAAGSGGLGGGPSSIWVFWLENYAALDRLLHDKSDEVSKAYVEFFSAMPKVTEKIREEVHFL